MRRTWTVLLSALLVVATVAPPTVYAAGPTIVMFYGQSLPKPIFITINNGEDANKYDPLFECKGDGILPRDIGNRPFVTLAMFWGKWDKYVTNPSLLPELVPTSAPQHGRLYLPTRTQPWAVLIRTQIRNGDPVPIPQDATGFELRCAVSEQGAGFLRQAGVPGL